MFLREKEEVFDKIKWCKAIYNSISRNQATAVGCTLD